jgi:hypothetical protein
VTEGKYTWLLGPLMVALPFVLIFALAPDGPQGRDSPNPPAKSKTVTVYTEPRPGGPTEQDCWDGGFAPGGDRPCDWEGQGESAQGHADDFDLKGTVLTLALLIYPLIWLNAKVKWPGNRDTVPGARYAKYLREKQAKQAKEVT